ncbi:hypothetical protein Syn7502_02276 [Synechococcus sp. PCC 7502]|uniref:hypothetical protein n=1 Tax=Synechococcus sp. PCC 7502 TaxID=1173263 RepID=UPI00029FF336|nr:hypothetical protein [Synechococcus sp. PCC 7502]AFY74281.1 hypothetical protein Syn7502_02276 [Synechococcus sp. PCC 7502]
MEINTPNSVLQKVLAIQKVPVPSGIPALPPGIHALPSRIRPLPSRTAAFVLGMGSVLNIMPTPRKSKIFLGHPLRKSFVKTVNFKDIEALKSDVSKVSSCFRVAIAKSIDP